MILIEKVTYSPIDNSTELTLGLYDENGFRTGELTECRITKSKLLEGFRSGWVCPYGMLPIINKFLEKTEIVL